MARGFRKRDLQLNEDWTQYCDIEDGEFEEITTPLSSPVIKVNDPIPVGYRTYDSNGKVHSNPDFITFKIAV